MRKIQMALLVFMLVIPTGAFAQIAQTLPTNDGRVGTIRESIRLAVLPPAVNQPQPCERSWPGRHPVLFGALVGLGTGLAIEAAVIPGESGGEPHSAYRPMFGSVGAGIGSLVGLIVSVARR